MAFIRRDYKDQETVITAENMNDIQDAILALEDGLFSVNNEKSGDVITITDAAKRGFVGFSIYGKTIKENLDINSTGFVLVSLCASGSITVNVSGDGEAQHMTIATPNGLPGVPVSSGGNYTDDDGQQWISDEIDLARGVYIKRTKKFAVNGADTESWTISEVQQVAGATRFDLNVTTVPRAGRKFCLCDGYMSTDTANKYAETCWCNDAETGATLQFRICTKNATTVAELKASLQAMPLDILYVLATPIETPLSAEEISNYAALHTYKEQTTVSNDAEAWMDLEYVMDGKKYIDSLVSVNVAQLNAVIERVEALEEKLS